MEQVRSTGERFLQINFLRLIHLEVFLKEFDLNTCTEIEKLFLEKRKWRQVWQVKMDKIMAQFHCRCLLRIRWLRVLKDRFIFRGTVVGQQRQQISELQVDKFPNPQSFMTWKTRFKTEVSSGSEFPSDAVLWIKELEMVDSLDDFQSSRPIAGKNFPNFEMLDAKIAFGSEQDRPEFPIQEEFQSRGTESPKRGSVSSRKTDRFHDLRLLSSDWRLWHITRLCWFILGYSSRWRRYKLGIRQSDELKKRVGIVRHGDSSEEIESRLSKVVNHGEE